MFIQIIIKILYDTIITAVQVTAENMLSLFMQRGGGGGKFMFHKPTEIGKNCNFMNKRWLHEIEGWAWIVFSVDVNNKNGSHFPQQFPFELRQSKRIDFNSRIAFELYNSTIK